MSEIIHILTGPTAVGKTELSLQWAETHGAEIVSADSLLFYRGMDIGTAKPSREEQARVPHHLIDQVDVTQRYSIKAYQDAALETVASIFKRGKQVLITGGSGFYLKAFFAPVVDAVEASPKIVDEVAFLEETGGLVAMLERLRELNPDGLGDLDIHNPRRVSKALERCLTSGQTLAELKAAFDALESPFAGYEKKVSVLSRDAEHLWERVCRRVDLMFEMGLLAEVEKLMKAGIRENTSAASAIGYRETIAYLENGDTDLVALKEQIAINTRKLIAKQRKWFRNHLGTHRVVDLDSAYPPILFT